MIPPNRSSLVLLPHSFWPPLVPSMDRLSSPGAAPDAAAPYTPCVAMHSMSSLISLFEARLANRVNNFEEPLIVGCDVAFWPSRHAALPVADSRFRSKADIDGF